MGTHTQSCLITLGKHASPARKVGQGCKFLPFINYFPKSARSPVRRAGKRATEIFMRCKILKHAANFLERKKNVTWRLCYAVFTIEQ